MSLLTSWDEDLGDDVGSGAGHDDHHNSLGEAVVSSMFDVHGGNSEDFVGNGGVDGGQDDVMDDAFLQEAIFEHAKFLGMDPVADKEFLWIAEEALTAPLPDGWQQANAEDGTPYHFNPDTGESLWEHPLDEVYRQKFRDEKEKKKNLQRKREREEEEEAKRAEEARREQLELERQQREKEERAERELQKKELERKQQERSERHHQGAKGHDAHNASQTNNAPGNPKSHKASSAASDGDWFNEIQQMSTVLNNGSGDSDNQGYRHEKQEADTFVEEFDADSSITHDARDTYRGTEQSTPARKKKSLDRDASLFRDQAAIDKAVAKAKAESQDDLRSKDAQITQLQKKMAQQSKEYENVLAEQRDILKASEDAMNELTDLHRQEIEELSAQVTRTREAGTAASEAHAIEIEKMQNELDQARERTISAEEAAAKANTLAEKKDEDLANAESEKVVLQSKLNTNISEKENLEQRISSLEQSLAASNSQASESVGEIEKFKEELQSSRASCEALARAKTALADEVRKLVNEKDDMISSVEDLRTELADSRRELNKSQAIIESVKSSAQAQQQRDTKLHEEALQQQKNHEATRLSELRRSFDDRCKLLVNEKSTMAGRLEEKISSLTAQLSDVQARASAVVADAEEAGREATSRLSDMRGNVEKMRRRAESAEEKLADMEREKEANKLEKERLQTRIDGLQSKNRSLETELNKNRQKEEIDDLKRKLVAAIKSEKEIKAELVSSREENAQMKEQFRNVLKSAMSRAATEALADCEGRWQVQIEKNAAEYVSREKQLVADLNAERERTRATQERIIDLERHSAQITAELDVLKRENASLHASLSRTREETMSRRPASSETMTSFVDPSMSLLHGLPPPAPANASGMDTFGLPLPSHNSLNESRQILAIQNRVQLMRAQADSIISGSASQNTKHRRSDYIDSIQPEASNTSLSILSDVTQDNDPEVAEAVAPIRGVSHKTSQILASLNLNTSVGHSRSSLSTSLDHTSAQSKSYSKGTQQGISPFREGHLDQKQGQQLYSSRNAKSATRSVAGWYQRGYWRTRYNLGGKT